MEVTIKWEPNEVETISRKVAKLASIKVDDNEVDDRNPSWMTLEGCSNPVQQNHIRPSPPVLPCTRQHSTSEVRRPGPQRHPRIKSELGQVKRCSDGWYIARTSSGTTLMYEYPTKEDARAALKEWIAEHPDETVPQKKQPKATSADEKYGTTIQTPFPRVQSEPGDGKLDLEEERLIRPCPQLVAVYPQSATKESVEKQKPVDSCPPTIEPSTKHDPGGDNFYQTAHSTSSSRSHPDNERARSYHLTSNQPQFHRPLPESPSQYRRETNYSYPDQQHYTALSKSSYRNFREYYHSERQYYPQYAQTRQHNYWPPARPYVAPRTPEYGSCQSQYDSRYRRYWKHQDVQNQHMSSQAYYNQPIYDSGSLRTGPGAKPWTNHGRQSSLPPMTPDGRSQLYGYESSRDHARQTWVPAPEIPNEGRVPPVYHGGNMNSRDLNEVPTSSKLTKDLPPATTDFLETEIAPAAEECNAYDATTDDSSANMEGWVKSRRGPAEGWQRHLEAKCYANRNPHGQEWRNLDRESQPRQHEVPSMVNRVSDAVYDEHEELNQRMTERSILKEGRIRNGSHEDYLEHEHYLPQRYRRTPTQQQAQSSWDKASMPSPANSHEPSFSRNARSVQHQSSKKSERHWQE